jgi:hypothetical protein
MTAKITGVHDGILTLVISGRLTQEELAAAQAEAARSITSKTSSAWRSSARSGGGT